MIVVSDTSPVLSLALIGRLDLLRELYGSIVIPAAVWQEIMATDQGGAQEVSQAEWIITCPIDPDVILKLLQREVDRGEAEAIGLALYSVWLFPFEAVSILLLVAMIGAVVMTRQEARDERKKKSA